MTGRREALVLIDLQKDYFVSDELERCRDDLVAICNRLVRGARDAGVPVIEVRTIHLPDRSTWTLTMHEDGQGMVLQGSRGAEPLDGLDTAEALVMTKTRDSAFFGTDLRQLLADRSVDHLVLCGVSTESCIAATASDAFAHDLGATLVADATASADRDLHHHTLSQLEIRFRYEVLDADELLERWRR